MTGTAEDLEAARTRTRSRAPQPSPAPPTDHQPFIKGINHSHKREHTVFEFVDAEDDDRSLKIVQHSRAVEAARFYSHARAAFRIRANEEMVLEATVDGMLGECCLVKDDVKDWQDLMSKIEIWWETKAEDHEAGDEQGFVARRCVVMVRLF